MNIQICNHKNNVSFKGYDARILRGVMMMTNYGGIADEMAKIGKREGFDVFINDGINPIFKLGKYQVADEFKGEWAQDILSFIKDNKLLLSDMDLASELLSHFKLKLSDLQKSLHDKLDFNWYKNILTSIGLVSPVEKNKFKFKDITGQEKIMSMDELTYIYQKTIKDMNVLSGSIHIPGGNFFVAKNKFGKELVLVGEEELGKFNKKEMRELFNNKNVEIIPQMDFHIDLFIRPLDEGKILLADDNLSLKMLDNYTDKLKKALLDNKFKNYKKQIKKAIKEVKIIKDDFVKNISDNPFEKIDLVEDELRFLGFDVIKVPGRFYEMKNGKLSYFSNFMNANVLLNKNKELVYITNEPLFDFLSPSENKLCKELKFSVKDEFYKYLEPYVKKEHLYFVSGKDNEIPYLLKELNGGIHCLCAEIPKFD